jgi:hypothetical protein
MSVRAMHTVWTVISAYQWICRRSSPWTSGFGVVSGWSGSA